MSKRADRDTSHQGGNRMPTMYEAMKVLAPNLFAISETSCGQIQMLQRRITGCRSLFDMATNELEEKIKRIQKRQDPKLQRLDRTEDERLSRAKLGGSSKLERAAQDLEVAAANISSIIADLRRLGA